MLEISGLERAIKIFQPNLGSGQTSQIDLDFNRGKRPVIKSLRCAAAAEATFQKKTATNCNENSNGDNKTENNV